MTARPSTGADSQATVRHSPRQWSRAARLTAASVIAWALVGSLATAYVFFANDQDSRPLNSATLAAAMLMAIATMANLGIRFVRWQHALRVLDVRIPTATSLGAYLGSFAFLPIPLGLGQMVARVRLTRHLVDAPDAVLYVYLWERVLDLWALTLVAAMLAWPAALPFIAALLLLPVLGPAWLAIQRLVVSGARLGADVLSSGPTRQLEAPVAELADLRNKGITLSLTAFAWLAPLLGLLVAGRIADVELPALAASAAAASTLESGVLPIPLGAGLSGYLLLEHLADLGVPRGDATGITFVFRASTVWLSAALGAVTLVLFRRRVAADTATDHFDHIDTQYDAWIPLHLRDHLVRKKTSCMLQRLGREASGSKALDIGCGRGWYMRELRSRGVEVTGVDISAAQLRAARESQDHPVSLARGSVTELAFRDQSFDFVYVVNVLHHLGSRERQDAALAEIRRVLKPGGVVFIHEMNIANPAFQFYLTYLFPILKNIDEGVEHFIDPRRLPEARGMEPVEVDYFTFLPDFLPGWAFRLLVPLETWLESSRLAPYSAHYVAVLRRGSA